MGDRLVGYLCALIGIIGFLYLISDRANAQPNPDYIQGLEQIVAACLSDATGRPIAIGGQWYLCGIVPIGEFK